MRSWHPQFVPVPLVPDHVQQQAKVSFNLPVTDAMSLDSRSQSTGRESASEHMESDHNNYDDYNDHHDLNSPDGLEPLNLNDVDIPFDGSEYSNDSNQSPLAEPSNAGSYDQPEALASDPAEPQVCNINRTYHPIINGGS
jgi:hypothetical protein